MNSAFALGHSDPTDLRRFRLEHALKAIELSALERVRDDLSVLLRVAVAA